MRANADLILGKALLEFTWAHWWEANDTKASTSEDLGGLFLFISLFFLVSSFGLEWHGG